jgi:hypothetical protein
MITRTSRSEWQRRAIIAETRVAELLRELADAIAGHAEGAARQEAAHADIRAAVMETTRHRIVAELRAELGCAHTARVNCARCRALKRAVEIVDEVMAPGGTAPAEDGTA